MTKAARAWSVCHQYRGTGRFLLNGRLWSCLRSPPWNAGCWHVWDESVRSCMLNQCAINMLRKSLETYWVRTSWWNEWGDRRWWIYTFENIVQKMVNLLVDDCTMYFPLADSDCVSVCVLQWLFKALLSKEVVVCWWTGLDWVSFQSGTC